MKYKLVYFGLSLLFLVPGSYFLLRFGLKPSIDFTGGSLLEISFIDKSQTIEVGQIRDLVADDFGLQSVQTSPDNTFLLRLSSLDQSQSQILQKQLQDNLGALTETRFATIGPILGKELIKKTLIGIAIATGFILFYLTYRFRDKKYGICAVLAMLHDTLIILGVFSFLGVYYAVEVDALFVTAILTILSFSVHDTIVVYDRIRETKRFHPHHDFTQVVNQAVNDTLTRSLNNSLTIIFMLLALFLLGGETIKWFIFALLIGTISGTYSSTFTAAPLLVLWEGIKQHHTSQV